MYLTLDIGEQLRACNMYLTYLPYLTLPTYTIERERERSWFSIKNLHVLPTYVPDRNETCLRYLR